MSAASQNLARRSVRGRLAGHTPGGRVAGYAFLIALALVSVGPLVWMVLTSLKPASAVFNGPLVPQHPQLNAYAYVIGNLGIGSYFLNSVIVTSITVIGVIVASSLAGYAFAFLPIPGKRVVFGVLMSALLIPAALFLIPAFIELRTLGLLNTQLGLALVHTGAGVPFAIFLMRSFFENIPTELRDAARMDGAREVTIFLRVALPLSLPGVATVAIFQVLFTWNDLMLSNGLIQDRSIQTLQPALYTLVGEHASNWPALTAALTIAAAPVIIFFVAVQRLFVAGLLAGSVKG
ncbi:MAG: binding-protein-dependent transport system inner rane component [Microbacteriaceae bacterium]|nr:binding-protein-dependent transport system inner rane component [Microbacteriaceae bacterium]